jgi:catechol-2,3-dioxygenase
MIGTLKTIVIDAPDIDGLAKFYTELAGWTTIYGDDEWITMTSADGWRLAMQHAPDHVAPRWPDPAHPQQLHLDIRVPDVGAATERAAGLGATLLRENETWNTLADPAGHPFDLCRNADDPRTTLMGVMLDCPDAKALSAFYSELLGKPVTYEADGAAMIGNDGERPILFQQVAEYVAPRWPDPAHPQQLHLDIDVEDVDAAEQAAYVIGATPLAGESGDGDTRFRVYADPAGHPFCFVYPA